MKTVILVSAVALSVLGAGCATDTPRVDAHLGQSVDWIAIHQTYDPFAGLVADGPLLPGDGVRLRNALDAHRKDVAPGVTQVSRSVVFDAGRQ